MIKHAFQANLSSTKSQMQALSAYPNSTIHLHHDVWLGHLDIASSPAVKRPFLVDVAGMTAKYKAHLTAVAISVCFTAYTVISEVTEKLDRALLTICHATPLLWRLKLAAALTITPREAQLLTERLVMLGGSAGLLWSAVILYRLLAMLLRLFRRVVCFYPKIVEASTAEPLEAPSADDGREACIRQSDHESSSSPSVYYSAVSTSGATSPPMSPSAMPETNQVPRVFLTPPSPTFRQIRYLAQKMPASSRMARFMRPAVGYWPSDYLAAFDEADRTGRKIKLCWRIVREDLATGRLIVLSEDVKEQFRAAQWEGVDWVDLE